MNAIEILHSFSSFSNIHHKSCMDECFKDSLLFHEYSSNFFASFFSFHFTNLYKHLFWVYIIDVWRHTWIHAKKRVLLLYLACFKNLFHPWILFHLFIYKCLSFIEELKRKGMKHIKNFDEKNCKEWNL